MNNKDKLFLANLQVALKEFTATDIGKTAKADLAALEKAAGGKKKLDEADRVLQEALTEASRLVAEGGAQVQSEREEFHRSREVVNAASDEERRQLEASRAANDKWSDDLASDKVELEAAMATWRAGKLVLDVRERELDGRTIDIDARDTKVTAREDAVKTREDYYASAP